MTCFLRTQEGSHWFHSSFQPQSQTASFPLRSIMLETSTRGDWRPSPLPAPSGSALSAHFFPLSSSCCAAESSCGLLWSTASSNLTKRPLPHDWSASWRSRSSGSALRSSARASYLHHRAQAHRDDHRRRDATRICGNRAPALAIAAGVEGLAAAFALISLGSGAMTLTYVVAALPVRPAEALRQWLIAPALLVVPFGVGAVAGELLIPLSPGVGRAILGVLVSLGLGLVCLGTALVLVRPAEYDALRRMLEPGAPPKLHVPRCASGCFRCVVVAALADSNVPHPISVLPPEKGAIVSMAGYAAASAVSGRLCNNASRWRTHRTSLPRGHRGSRHR